MQTMLGRCAGAALGVTLLVACGGGGSGGAGTKAAAATTPVAAAPAGTAGAKATLALDLGEVTVYDGDEALFKLHKDGTTELGDHAGGQTKWYPGPTFRADGTLLVDGEVKAKLTADGIAIAGADALLPLVVSADTVAVESVSFSLAADGALQVSGLDTGGTKLRFEAQSLGQRHTGLVVWTALFVLAQAQSAR